MAISGNQLKAARAIIGFDQKQLAERSGIGINTIRNMETAGPENIKARTQSLDAITAALKSAGVVFLDEGQAGRGVWIKN